MSYLFAAYTIVWIILCAYVFRLAKQGRALRVDMARLQERLGEREGNE
jgi:CcmD family protein